MRGSLRVLWGVLSVIGIAIPTIVGAGVVTAATIQEQEPNDDFETAQMISEGNVVGKIEGGESDYYRVEANTTDALDIDVEAKDGTVNLRVYDPERDELASDDNRGSGDSAGLVRKIPTNGTYYIEVAGYYDGTTTEYTLDFNKVTPSENDEYAPNDDVPSAAPITERFTDAKIWGGESDYYRVEANTTDALDIEVEAKDGTVNLRVYDPERDELASDDNRGSGDSAGLVRKIPTDGTYYIEVAGYYDGTTTEYTLQSNLSRSH